MNNFGTTVRNLRTSQGLSQEKLAEKSGINTTTIILVERGISQPCFSTADLLIRALGYEMDVNSENFGKTIRKMRKGQGLTQKQLAAMANISVTALIHLEHDRNGPTLSTATSLYKALGHELTLKRRKRHG